MSPFIDTSREPWEPCHFAVEAPKVNEFARVLMLFHLVPFVLHGTRILHGTFVFHGTRILHSAFVLHGTLVFHGALVFHGVALLLHHMLAFHASCLSFLS